MHGNLRKALDDWCRHIEIPLVGVANVRRWEEAGPKAGIPHEFFPQSIYPESQSVIVIGLPVNLPILETSPSIWYHELYKTVNHLLDQYTYRLSLFLSEQGFPSVFVPRDGYAGIEALKKNPIAFFSHRHAAYLAGLGTFGVHNMLLTPRYGPRVRFGSVFTMANLPSDAMIRDELCTHCMHCVACCPAQALSEGEYPAILTDKQACVDHSMELNRRGISPCGICIRVCPVGKDRSHYHREEHRIYEDEVTYKNHHKAWRHVRDIGHR